MAEKITALFVRHIKRPGRYGDGRNLYLQVRKSKNKTTPGAVNKSWTFRYVRQGRQTWLGLGPYPDVSLAEARELATQARKLLLRGIDPLTDKRARQRATRAAQDNMLSFAECAERYIDSQAPGGAIPSTLSNGEIH